MTKASAGIPHTVSPEHAILLARSFEQVRPVCVEAAALFYDKLFEIDPGTRALFKSDLTLQGAKLIAVLERVIRWIRWPGLFHAQLRGLGVRHAAYGVKAEHYASVGTALVWTLEQALGDEFTPQVKDAWVSAYTLICEAMMETPHDGPRREHHEGNYTTRKEPLSNAAA